MKVTFTKSSKLSMFSGKGLFAMMIALLFSFPVFGQAFSPEDEVGDLSEVKWKPTGELLTSIAAEHSKMAVALSSPSIAPDEKALFKGYERLLTYVQIDLQAGIQLQESILTAYKKVLQEAPTDPELKYMPDGVLATFIPGLVEVLSTSIVPTASN